MAVFRKPGLLLAAVALCFLAAPPALAQDDAAKAQAKALFGSGKEHFQAQRYPQALAAFEQANAIKPHPLMLYNIGQVYEAMNDLPRALETYEKFLAAAPADTADVKDRVARIKKTLSTSWGSVSLSSEPLGATVWVGSKESRPQGRTPITVQVPAKGPATIILEKEGFKPKTLSITAKVGKVEQLGVIAMLPLLPVVSVRSEPSLAKVTIDGTSVGTTPISTPLPAGKHTAVLEVEGRAPVTREFTLGPENTADRPLILDVAFGEAAPTGLLEVAVDRPGADVLVDGQKVGASPLSGPLTLPAGAHKLQVLVGGDEVHEETVIVSANETARAEVEIGDEGGGLSFDKKQVGFYGMIGGGAVLAAGAVFGVMATGANSDLEDCRGDKTCNGTSKENSLADDVRSRALLTDILIGAGIAIAGGGAALWLLSDEPAPATPAPTVTVAPLPGGGAAAVGTFEF